MNTQEINTCSFCRNVTSVRRQYLHAKIKPMVGDGFDYIYYCNECGLLEYDLLNSDDMFSESKQSQK